MREILSQNYEAGVLLQYRELFTSANRVDDSENKTIGNILKINLNNTYNYLWGNKTKLEKDIIKYNLGQKFCYNASCFSTVLAYFSHEFSKCLPESKIFTVGTFLSVGSALLFGYGRNRLRNDIKVLNQCARDCEALYNDEEIKDVTREKTFYK